jgi:hypothetical protein
MADQPFLRRAFDRVERTIGKPLEDAVQSSRLTTMYLAKKRVERTIRAALDRPTGAFLDLINIPARSDVRRVNRQIAALTEEVRSLSARLDEQQAPRSPLARQAQPRAASDA